MNDAMKASILNRQLLFLTLAFPLSFIHPARSSHFRNRSINAATKAILLDSILRFFAALFTFVPCSFECVAFEN